MPDRVPTILCVDDDPEILHLLEEYLTRQGFHVVTATNGVDAVFATKRWAPRAVILDLFMPRLGGLGAMDRIRRLDAGIVIILISGVPDALELVAEAGVSVAGALKKPFDFVQLLGTLVQAGVMPPSRVPEGEILPPAAAASPPAGLRILVVDDEPEIRDVFSEHLQVRGYEVQQAADGEEALRLIPEFRPHVVLLDIAMPGLSGVETLRRIKGLSLETSVVMVSGVQDEETARRTLAMGAADYVTKPVDFQYLESVLEIHRVMDEI